MADLKYVALAIFAWILIVIGMYFAIAPVQGGVVQEQKFKDFVTYTVVIGIAFILILFFYITQTTKGAFIISPFQALSELTLAEKAKAKVKNINNMKIFGMYPRDGGKSCLIKYEIEEGEFKGNTGWITLNCMSDYKSSATDIPRTTRLIACDFTGLSYVSASSYLKSDTKSNVDKILKLTKEVQRVSEKGGEKARQVLEDVAEQEERRMEGDD